MSSSNENQHPPLPKLDEQTPDYIKFETKARDQFLSQIGNFTPGQRTLFHRLCTYWTPEIDYKKFISSHTSDIKNAEAELEKVMSRLKAVRLGLITTRVSEGERKKEKILLTPQDDFRFYYHRLGEEYEELNQSISNPFPTKKTLGEKNIHIPALFSSVLSPDNLHKYFIDEQTASQSIFSINVSTDDPVIVPSNKLQALINIAVRKIRYVLKNQEALNLTAKIKNTTLAKINQIISSSDPLFWLDIAKTIAGNAESYEALRRVSIDHSFYQSAEILLHYVTNQLNENKKRNEEEKQKREDMKLLASRIKVQADIALTQMTFDSLAEEFKSRYEGGFQKFKDEFFEQFIKPREKTSLPVIVFVNKYYIHRDNLYPFFLNRLGHLKSFLQNEYQEIMKYIIRTNNKEELTLFYSQENFQEDIEGKVKKNDPFISYLFQNPRLLAELILYGTKQADKNRSIDELKEYLWKYFKYDTMLLKNLAEIFELETGILFDKAFSELSLLKQLILKFTGRYEMLRERYTSLAQLGREGKGKNKAQPLQKKETSKKQPFSPAVTRKTTTPKPQPGKRKTIPLKPAAASGGEREKIAPGKPLMKTTKKYSRREQEEAWRKFKKSIK
ncbi:MAG: hypothetical protein AB1798_08185 [Spirochaetota bacterium]